MKIVLALAIALIISLFAIASAQDMELQDEYNLGDNANYTTYANNWGAQTFTASQSYSIEQVRLKLWRTNAPGWLTVEIQSTTAGTPDGVALSSGTLNANAITTDTGGAWYSIPMGDYGLETGEVYALVFYASAGYSNNTVEARYHDAGTYAGGVKYVSTNGGVTWAASAGEDFMFEVWGQDDLIIHSVQVWSNYKEADDWLITAYYTCAVNPQYDEEEPPEKWYNLQLITGNCTAGTVTEQSPIRYWDGMVASIYISADEAETLEWQPTGNTTEYSIRLYSSINSVCQSIVNTDWRGQNLSELDSWCISVARKMENIDDKNYVIDIATRGFVLNTNAGGMFSIGIPELAEERGKWLFQEYQESFERPTATYEAVMQDETDMEARLGPYAYTAIETAADEMGIETYILGFLGIALMYFIMATRGVPIGHSGVGMALSVGILMIGLYTGTFLWIWFTLIAIIAAALFVYHMIVRQV